MPLTATATQGFELLRHTTENEVIYIPGDPGDTLTRNDQVVCTVGEGLADPAAANEGGIIGRVTDTVIMPAASQAFPLPLNDFDPVAKATADKCLVGLSVNVGKGLPIYLVTFKNHWDDTVISYTASTRAIALTTGMTADDYPNGALLYVYEGPGIGEVNVVEDYDHTGGAAELLLICHRAFKTALTSASKLIVVGGEGAASRGVGFFNKCEGADENELTVNQGADDGDYTVFLDWRDAATHLKNLRLPVIPSRWLLQA